MFYQREIYSELLKHLSRKQVTVLTGMRRTGKTTLVKKLMAESPVKLKNYFEMERIDNRMLFSEPKVI